MEAKFPKFRLGKNKEGEYVIEEITGRTILSRKKRSNVWRSHPYRYEDSESGITPKILDKLIQEARKFVAQKKKEGVIVVPRRRYGKKKKLELMRIQHRKYRKNKPGYPHTNWRRR